jgi:predicted secreted protein
MAVPRFARALAATAALAIAVTGLLAAPSASAAPLKKNFTLTVTSLPAQVRLVPGESVKLQLSTNLTTGYTWSIKVTGKASSIVVSDGRYVAPTSGLMGAPGTTTWNITAKAKGTGVVKVLTKAPGARKSTVDGTLTVIVM